MKILMTGDLHMGRGSSKLRELPPQTAIACWREIVIKAIELDVQVVLLSGDVVDRQNRFYESHAPLEQGVRDLASNGISTVAVAGNHDFDVLRNLHQAIEVEQFHLLGTGERWESLELTHQGETLRLDGWSFSSPYVQTSPLATYPEQGDDADYHIGLVHGDLEGVGSRYAPLALKDLQEKNVDGWLLGHIHKPHLISQSKGPWVLYPGSPQALDPGEPGIHGCWIIESESDDQPEFLPLSTVCYESLVVDISECEEAADVLGFVFAKAKTTAMDIKTQSHAGLQAVALRIEIIGECSDPASVREMLNGYEEWGPLLDETSVWIDKLQVTILPRLEKSELRQQTTALARAFQLLEELDSDNLSRDSEKLYSELARKCRQQCNKYRGIDHAEDFVDRILPSLVRLQLSRIVSDLRRQRDE
ncbi:MAG: DNA repair exonuclease [Planctomycetota bacterium]|nr:DNA repair exonuclease [Planctomycetota bacterium]